MFFSRVVLTVTWFFVPKGERKGSPCIFEDSIGQSHIIKLPYRFSIPSHTIWIGCCWCIVQPYGEKIFKGRHVILGSFQQLSFLSIRLTSYFKLQLCKQWYPKCKTQFYTTIYTICWMQPYKLSLETYSRFLLRMLPFYHQCLQNIHKSSTVW